MKTICVFCSASDLVSDFFKSLAGEVGRELVRAGFRVVYGGSDYGMMGTLARGALSEGGFVTGVVPKVFGIRDFDIHELSECLHVEDFFERKKKMLELADGFLVLPGGMGTLDEVVEMICYKQVQIHNKPVVFLNSHDFWNTFLQFVMELQQQSFVRQKTEDLFSVGESPKQAVDLLVQKLAQAGVQVV